MASPTGKIEVRIRDDAEHKRDDFIGRPSAAYRVMGIVGVEPFLVRLADTEEECMSRNLNNAAIGAFSEKERSRIWYWTERWSESQSKWTEV